MENLQAYHAAFSQDDPLVLEAWRLALEARERAWAPYSGFRVGASVWYPQLQRIVCGVNVENASYGATICAERGAILSAIAQFGKHEPGFVLVATASNPPAVPCGMCLQVLTEFCKPTMPVFLATLDAIVCSYRLADLAPHAFTAFQPDISS